ncbi:CTLH/CRA C-terminal to LisH motif domain [Trinorchestia longiramus]|nr:CTLH/CRA C-terminal to LisH motif domain [Trinorchestia longiramus]
MSVKWRPRLKLALKSKGFGSRLLCAIRYFTLHSHLLVRNMAADPRAPVANEIDKVLDKFTNYETTTVAAIENVEEKLQELLEQMENAVPMESSIILDDSVEGSEDSNSPRLTSEQVSNLIATLEEAKSVCSGVSSKHRELHSFVSKVGKAIDKNFENSYSFMQTSTPFLREETRPRLYEIVCNHLCREGLQSTADQLMEDCDMSLRSEFMSTFREVNQIVAALKEKDLQPAMKWATNNTEKLREKKSGLEFKLHRLAFISLVAGGAHNLSAAVEYARDNFTPFIPNHQSAIQHVMGSLVFMRTGLENTPYSALLQPSQWEDLIQTFTKDACTVLGVSLHSPLGVCISAGCTALPVLLNINQALNSQVHNMWSAKEELPIEISLGKNSYYHSIFSCPIMRQQSTESNPPMRLTCGHVISKDALVKLTQASNKRTQSSRRVKCPYCPVEQSPQDPLQIIF